MASVVAAQPAQFLHIVIANGTQFSGLANLSTLEPHFSFEGFARAAGYA
ncbi:MAG: thiamine pyrophosphate-binding protein, partial [Betaproteobacteria bacterium]|nr:thiamine pyrophosphate-binding protein [Betaproteobacteria bacterium]